MFNFLLVLFLFGMLVVAGITHYILPGLPDITSLKNVKMQVPLRIYTGDGSLISEFGEKIRTPINIDEVPNIVIDAFLAAEDDRFYEHLGVDWQGTPVGAAETTEKESSQPRKKAKRHKHRKHGEDGEVTSHKKHRSHHKHKSEQPDQTRDYQLI